MNEHTVIQAIEYDRIDGRNAYQSKTKKITLGSPALDENKAMKIAAQIWKETEGGGLEMTAELPIHQILDLMLLLGRSMLYFREAYRMPLLYDPVDPSVERLGVQGDAMQIEICTDNPEINMDIQEFCNALNELGDLTGERLRSLGRILEEMQY